MKNELIENSAEDTHLDLFGSVEPHEYENCRNIESVSLWGAYEIGEYAFAGCTNLREFDVCGELDVIRDFAFFNCTGLKSICIPDTAVIEEHAFDGAFSQ